MVEVSVLQERPQSLGEEIANSVSHGLGLLAALAAFPVLVIVAHQRGNATGIVGASVFATTMVLLYLTSTLFHALPGCRAKRVFQILDHSAIYLLIAGTYTPFTLGVLRGVWGWTLFGLVWGLSLLGILFKVFFVDHFKIVSTTVYLVMGWLVVIALKPLLALVPSGGILWLLAGGVLYTIGVGFYAWRKLSYNHAIWHVLVLAGSICHYFAVLFYVLPAKA